MKRPTKHEAISIFDYPRNNFSAYWEYIVTATPNGKTRWSLRIMSYDKGKVLETFEGGAADETEARQQAQAKVASVIEKYRLPKPKIVIDDAKADALQREFDATRAALVAADDKTRARLFARIDQIRGLLKANGYVLREPESIMSPADSQVETAVAQPTNTPVRKKSWLSDMLRR